MTQTDEYTNSTLTWENQKGNPKQYDKASGTCTGEAISLINHVHHLVLHLVYPLNVSLPASVWIKGQSLNNGFG